MKVLGLIGNPVSHSRSPEIFQQFFEQENRTDFSYRLFPLDTVHDLPALVTSTPDLIGLNVTVPFKQAVIPMMQHIHSSAAKAGAVNTIRIHRTNSGISMEGYNTDIDGFKKSLLETFPNLPENALILGTGGASAAVAAALDDLRITWKKVSRDPARGIIYADLNSVLMESHPLIVNTTPLGMGKWLEAQPAIPYELITPNHLCFDLVYNPEKTLFLRSCENQGAAIKNGLDMLRYQAAASWSLFKGE